MQICNIEPFVRKVTKVRLSETTHYDVYNELRASDCRLFYSVNGSGSIVTEGFTDIGERPETGRYETAQRCIIGNIFFTDTA